MREIKFRGMDIDGRWFYGLPCIIKEGSDKGAYISNKSGMPKAYQIRPETLTQYTGLKDKNGVEVYEGDILYHKLQGKRKVYYPMDDRFAGFGLQNAIGMKNTLQDTKRLYEVLGNIFENPELLEVSGE